MISSSKTCVEIPTDTNNAALIRTDSVVTKLRAMTDGWGGLPTSKKPGRKTLNKMRRILAVLEEARLPWPDVTVVPNGCIVLGWQSLTRDMQMNIDLDGDVQFVTSLKRVDEGGNVTDQLDSEGHVVDMITVDHMMAWYCMSQAHAA